MVPSSNIVPPSDDAYQLHIVESYIKVILPGDELSMIALSIFTLSTWRTTRAWSRALPLLWALRGGRWPGGGAVPKRMALHSEGMDEDGGLPPGAGRGRRASRRRRVSPRPAPGRVASSPLDTRRWMS